MRRAGFREQEEPLCGQAIVQGETPGGWQSQFSGSGLTAGDPSTAST